MWLCKQAWGASCAEKLDSVLDSLRKDSAYMAQRAERQAEARERWVEGLSFQPESIKQADRPPPSAGERVKETLDKVTLASHTPACLSSPMCCCKPLQPEKLMRDPAKLGLNPPY